MHNYCSTHSFFFKHFCKNRSDMIVKEIYIWRNQITHRKTFHYSPVLNHLNNWLNFLAKPTRYYFKPRMLFTEKQTVQNNSLSPVSSCYKTESCLFVTLNCTLVFRLHTTSDAICQGINRQHEKQQTSWFLQITLLQLQTDIHPVKYYTYAGNFWIQASWPSLFSSI